MASTGPLKRREPSRRNGEKKESERGSERALKKSGLKFTEMTAPVPELILIKQSTSLGSCSLCDAVLNRTEVRHTHKVKVNRR